MNVQPYRRASRSSLPFSPWWSLPLVPALRVLGARLAARARHKATGLLLCSLPQALYESLGVFACDLFREGGSDRKAHAGFDGFCGGV